MGEYGQKGNTMSNVISLYDYESDDWENRLGAVEGKHLRRPVVAEWMRNRTDRRSALRWYKRNRVQTVAFHTARTPKYAAKLGGCAPVGMGRAFLATARWVSDWDSRPVRREVISQRDVSHFTSVEKLHQDRVRFRAGVLAGGAVAATAGGLWLNYAGSELEHVAAIASTIGGFGWLGRPQAERITESAVISSDAQRPTHEVITRALSSLGIDGVARALKEDPQAIRFPAPVSRDGSGWRAVIDLPAGITAAQVIERRERLAGALGRPLGSVFPEGDATTSPGRLVLWVGDEDMASTPQSAWPLAETKQLDIFEPFAFGEDYRRRPIELCLAETNMLIGAIPGAGKTTTLRAVLLAAVLDPRVELWLWEHKGTGDFAAFKPVATRYGSGADDETLLSALQGLKDLRKECSRRAKLISELAVSEHMVTSEIANTPGLHPLVVAIDELQELMKHKTYGKEAGELAEQIIKLGRALGVILLLATQRPDADSLPAGISANVGTRFCLRVMDHISNDMVLGTSAHRRGITANTFTKRDRGMGWLVGQHDDPQIVRVFNVDSQLAHVVVERAMALRGGVVVQSGPAQEPQRVSGLLADVLEVADPEERLWFTELTERLRERCDRYDELSPELLGIQLRDAGIETRQIGRRDGTKTRNQRGIRIEDVLAKVKESR